MFAAGAGTQAFLNIKKVGVSTAAAAAAGVEVATGAANPHCSTAHKQQSWLPISWNVLGASQCVLGAASHDHPTSLQASLRTLAAKLFADMRN